MNRNTLWTGLSALAASVLLATAAVAAGQYFFCKTSAILMHGCNHGGV